MRPRRWRSAFVGLCLVAGGAGVSSCTDSVAIGGTIAQQSCAARAASASIGRVAADARLDRRWAAYRDTNKGWTGGDSVFAYNVPFLGKLWTFADAFVGGLLPAGARVGTGMIHSLFVVERSETAFRVRRREHGNTTLLGPAKGPVFYLSLAGAVNRNDFQELYTVRKLVGKGPLQAAPAGNVLATFSLPSLNLVGTKPVGGNPAAVVWGSNVSRFGGYSYVYGASALSYDKNGFVARIRGTDLNGLWTYWEGNGWSANPAAARPFATGVEQEYSVTLVDGVYVLVSSDGRTPFSPYASVSFGCSPIGPFSNYQRFLVSDAVGQMGAWIWHLSDVYVYDAVAQPALAAPAGDVVISYNQNSLYYIPAHDGAVYLPGYLDLPLHIPAP
jgi:hypothetical protein